MINTKFYTAFAFKNNLVSLLAKTHYEELFYRINRIVREKTLKTLNMNVVFICEYYCVSQKNAVLLHPKSIPINH